MPGSFRITYEGLPELRQYLTQVRAGIMTALLEAVNDNAMLAFRESQKYVPHADGILAASGVRVPATQRGNTVVAELGYGGAASKYALIQHEDMSLNHPDPTNPKSRPQGQAKYLEDPVRDQIPQLERDLTQRIRKVLKAR